MLFSSNPKRGAVGCSAITNHQPIPLPGAARIVSTLRSKPTNTMSGGSENDKMVGGGALAGTDGDSPDLMNGDGGDESFAGYERYLAGRLTRHYQRIPRLIRRLVLEPLARQFLHAARLSFVHPFSGERVELESPLPPDLETALQLARRD